MLLNHLTAFVVIVHCTYADPFKPFVKEGPRKDLVVYPGNINLILMNEEIAPPIVIAIIDGFDSRITPVLGRFEKGDNLDLNLSFELNGDSEWEMIVNNKQDYEQAAMRIYMFEVLIDVEVLTVYLHILNTFENPPIVTSFSNPCRIPELEAKQYISSCIYNVFSIDGMNENLTSLAIQGTKENSLFEFVKSRRVDSWNFVYTLMVREMLYYDQQTIYNFRTNVTDQGGNQIVFSTIIEVEDKPNKQPMWVRVFSSERFLEKKAQNFNILAIDGDTGIDANICYRLEFPLINYSDIIAINSTTGQIDVQPIDRDARKNAFYSFEIFAFKCETPLSFISNPVVLVVDDVNDNLPEIFFPPEKSTIRILEQTFDTLLSTSELYVLDIDLGPHAVYKVELLHGGDGTNNFAEAFNIIPSSGYQNQTFAISVIDTNLIDYENEAWETFEIIITATETIAPYNQASKSFKVELINWNDELPIFDNEIYIFEVPENVLQDFLIGRVRAVDRDIGDTIEYFIDGRVVETISININNGELRTVINETFDYERQTKVFIQVQARDTLQTSNELTHTTFAQVRIDVIDVNDETPQLIMPREVFAIKENTNYSVFDVRIEANDPDTTAKLQFSIDWEKSYATKPGFTPERQLYVGCFLIEKVNGSNENSVMARLNVNTSFEHKLNTEIFENIYLTIIVEDVNQKIMPNWASATLIIRIEDETFPQNFEQNKTSNAYVSFLKLFLTWVTMSLLFFLIKYIANRV